MKCPNCGAQMGLEDAVCPYCNTPNAMAVQHQADMARYRQEYEQTQADVIAKASLMQRHGSWLIVLAVLLAAMIAGIILNIAAWDIGYSIREQNVARGIAEDMQVMDGYLEAGEYGKFLGYYDANGIVIIDDNPYQGVRTVAQSYANLIEYVAMMHDNERNAFRPDRVSDTCGYIAGDLNRIFTIEEYYAYNVNRYLPADKLVYVEDMRDRAAAIAKAYFGLTDEQIREIPNMSKSRLAALIEEGIA